jgi:putative endonuclease
MTRNLIQRTSQHLYKLNINSFTHRYNINKLIYYESYIDWDVAYNREHQIKKWRREKKENLINTKNSDWKDLIDEWDK